MAVWDEIVSFGSLLDGVGAHTEDVRHFELDDRVNGRVSVRRMRMGRVTLSTVRSTGHRITSFDAETITYFAPLNGTIRVRAGSSDCSAHHGGGVFVRPGLRSSRVIPLKGDNFYGVAVSAPMSAGAPSGAPAARAYPDVSLSSAAHCLHGFLQYFVREYSRPDSLLKKQGMLVAAETLIGMCLDELNAEGRSEAATSLGAMAQRVDDAEKIIRERLTDPLSIGDLSRELGVSARTLQVAFKAVRGVSPIAAIKQMRLDCARQRLLSAEAEASVTEIALSCGFEHLGRFSQDFRRRFGESPSSMLHSAQKR